MSRLHFLLGAAAAALAACGPGIAPRPEDASRIQFRALDAVNTLRSARGLVPLELNSQLIAAAATHSRDMARQQRPWAFGSDGSSPIERVQRSGYPGRFRGMVISETFEDELETINAWMIDPDDRRILLDSEARDMGIAGFREPNGKLWWTLITGARSPAPFA